jgi:toxic protein SymE
MAATNFKPEFTVCKTESDAFTGVIENRELVRQKQRPAVCRRPTRRPSILERKGRPPAANSMHALT